MTTLLSPVGTADPITILGDGPMLHIVRMRRPEKVVLFLSPKMAGYQERDQRYTRAIELLSSSEGLAVPEIHLIESDNQEVHRFDLFMDEFEDILRDLVASGERVLVNTSSGTAGMAQALVALGSFGRLDIELLQVTTPRNDTNEKDDREDPDNYDLESLWDLDCDSADGSTNRVSTVQTPNFAERLLRENVSSLCHSFEFEAANELVQKMTSVSDTTKQMVAAAAARLNLDGNLSAKAFGGTELSYKSNDLLLEYLYVMEARLKQGHYADFVRALSPAFTELLKRCLRTCLPADRYMIEKPISKDGKRVGFKDTYNVDAIRADERLSKTLTPHHFDTTKTIYTAAFMALVDEYCEDRDTVAKLQTIRDVEERVRNSLAHSLRVSSRSSIEKQCGTPLDRTMALLFELHGSANPGLYERIADAIDASLNGARA
ncbi:type III-A CRISPR-associated CARF protein Csm6 [Paratractidigestivibacter sp.]|uniref:type III-A CRISPR-associated CARF protein Csm6 n=1 Tax=Paratractidigestivibacter sp. TaxID=2847316 RepID=UPI002ACB0D64|nr:hypothetical protein [Paratractidigestivibacter sp.]